MFETIEKPVKLHPRTKQPMSNSVPEVDIVIKRTIPFNERPKVTNSKSATEIFRKFLGHRPDKRSRVILDNVTR